MKEKNMGYSPEKLIEILSEMESLKQLSQNSFSYKSVTLTVEPLPPDDYNTHDNILKIKRSLLFIEGKTEDEEAFYMKFLLNNLTMGG